MVPPSNFDDRRISHQIFSPEEIIYSSKIPNAERKWKRVIQLEENLLAHPLALFPNLEQGINPDLYEEIGKKSFSIVKLTQNWLKHANGHFDLAFVFSGHFGS